jgi:phage tail-like protein
MTATIDSPTGLATRFNVTIDNNSYHLGPFTSAKGLEVQWDLIECRSGESGNDRVYYAGRTRYTNIRLERRVESDGTRKVREWLNSNSFRSKPQSGKIEMFDAGGTAVTSWTLAHVIPVKWSVSPFDSGAQKVAIETLELAHMGFLDDEST